MICSDSSQQLSAYLDEELPPAERVALEAHLGSCSACTELLASLREASRELGALPAIEVGASFRRKVLSAIDAERREAETSRAAVPERARRRVVSWRARWAWPTLGALGAAAAAFLAIARGPANPGDPGNASDLAIAGELELFENYPSVQLVDAIDGPEDVAVVADLDRLGAAEGPR